MFSDPQTVTVNAVDKIMPKVETKGLSSIYKMADDSYKLTISHSPQRDRIRSMVRVDHRAVVADPLTQVNDYETLAVYVVIDRPVYGFSSNDIEAVVTGLVTWLEDTDTVERIVGSES